MYLYFLIHIKNINKIVDKTFVLIVLKNITLNFIKRD